MLSDKKSKPSDGSEDESDEMVLEQYVKDSEQEYEETKERERSNFKSLKRDRGYADQEPDKDEKESNVKNPFHSNDKKENDFAALSMRKRAGIFGGGTKRTGFGMQTTKKKIEKTLRAGAIGVSIKKQREFMQMLGKYQGLKGKNQSTLEKSELVKFESGLRHGVSDLRFKKFSQQLKEEGIIKNVTDVKKLFNRNDTRRMTDVLMGRKSSTGFRAVGKAGLMERRVNGTDSKPTGHQ